MKINKSLTKSLLLLLSVCITFSSCGGDETDSTEIIGAEDVDISINENSTFNMTQFIKSFEQGCFLPTPFEQVWMYEFSHDYEGGKVTKSYAKDIRYGEFGDVLIFTHQYNTSGVLTSSSRNNEWCQGGGADEEFYDIKYDKQGYISGYEEGLDNVEYIYNDDMSIAQRIFNPKSQYSTIDTTIYTHNDDGLIFKSEKIEIEFSKKTTTTNEYAYNEDKKLVHLKWTFQEGWNLSSDSEEFTYDEQGRMITDGSCEKGEYYDYSRGAFEKRVYSDDILLHIFTYGSCSANKEKDFPTGSMPHRLIWSYRENGEIYECKMYVPVSGTSLDGELELKGGCTKYYDTSDILNEVRIWDANGEHMYTIKYPSGIWYSDIDCNYVVDKSLQADWIKYVL